MTEEQIIGLIITGVIVLLTGAMGVVMLTGKGAFLIAGFNTMHKEKQAKYNKEKLSKFMGLVLLAVTLCTAGMTLGFVFEIKALWIAGSVLLGAVIIFAIIFANAKAFKKNELQKKDEINGEENME